jgi:hypothetical protein
LSAEPRNEDSDLEAVIPTLFLNFPSPKGRVRVLELVVPVLGLHPKNWAGVMNKGFVCSRFACLVPEQG